MVGLRGARGKVFVGRCLGVGHGEEEAWQAGDWWRDIGSIAVIWVILLVLQLRTTAMTEPWQQVKEGRSGQGEGTGSVEEVNH